MSVANKQYLKVILQFEKGENMADILKSDYSPVFKYKVTKRHLMRKQLKYNEMLFSIEHLSRKALKCIRQECTVTLFKLRQTQLEKIKTLKQKDNSKAIDFEVQLLYTVLNKVRLFLS